MDSSVGTERPTIEQAARMALESLERRAQLGLKLTEGSIPDVLRAVRTVTQEAPGRLSSGEVVLANLAFALWSGSRAFGIADLAVLDARARAEALAAIETWNRAIS